MEGNASRNTKVFLLLLFFFFCLSLTKTEAFTLQPGTVEIKKQEWRETPTRHLYIEGTLNKDTDFVLYMPEAKMWKGRLLQVLGGGLGGKISASKFGFQNYALAKGAVLLESTQGHRGEDFYEEDDTPRENFYEANFAVLQVAKWRSVELYGKTPEFVYVTGGSGGGFRSSVLIEMFPKEYDGALPFVGGGHFKTVLYNLSLMEALFPRLSSVWEKLADRAKPGSKTPLFAGLTEDQVVWLEMLLKAGYPRSELGIWTFEKILGPVGIDLLKRKLLPQYFQLFWKDERFEKSKRDWDKTEIEAKVTAILGERSLALSLPKEKLDLHGFTLVFLSGSMKGEWMIVQSNKGNKLTFSRNGPPLRGVKKGDKVLLKNDDLLSFRAIHRYIVECWDRGATPFCEKGKPLFFQPPRRELGDLYEPFRKVGKIKGKVIALFGTGDHGIWPTVGDRYARQVKKALGRETNQHFRIYFIEHGTHLGTLGNPKPSGIAKSFLGEGEKKGENLSRLTPLLKKVRGEIRGSSIGTIFKALDLLMGWVEEENAPPPSTDYSFDSLTQIQLPSSPKKRGGIQPIITLKGNGKRDRIEGVARGKITFEISAESPDDVIALLEIDPLGKGLFRKIDIKPSRKVAASFSYRYQKKGIYFPVARATDSSQVDGMPETFLGLLRLHGSQNIATMRVVVR